MSNANDGMDQEIEAMEDDARQFEEYSQTVEVPFRSPFDADVESFRAEIEARANNHQRFTALIMERLADGTDYGRIHIVHKNKCREFSQGRECTFKAHYSKPVLFKPGSEKIAILLGLTPRFPQISDARWLASISEAVAVECDLIDRSGVCVAQGVGARKLAQDYGDLNKSLKMACKSAMIDATLRVAGLSAMFTQDLDETPPAELGEHKQEDEPQPERTHEDPTRVTGKQVIRLEARISALKLPRERVKAYCEKRWGSPHFSNLSPANYNEVDKKLEEFAAVYRSEAIASAQREPIAAGE